MRRRPFAKTAPPLALLLSATATCASRRTLPGAGAGVDGNLLRGDGRDARERRRVSHARVVVPNDARRRLSEDDGEEGDDDDGASSGDDDDGASSGDDDQAAKYYGYDDDVYGNSTNSTFGTFQSMMRIWEHEFYDSPPSEWTTGQWDAVCGLLFGAFVACCLGASCCAYNSVDVWEGKDEEEDDGETVASPASSKTPRTRPNRRGRGGLRDRLARDRRQRRREDADDDCTVETEANDDLTVDTGHVTRSRAESGRSKTRSTVYVPPSAAAAAARDVMSPLSTTSLAEYTTVQREKEGRMYEVWKEARDGRGEGASEGVVDDYDGWKEEYDARFTEKSSAYRGKLRSSLELDAALSNRKRNPKEDKLLEERELRHNFVGYYL